MNQLVAFLKMIHGLQLLKSERCLPRVSHKRNATVLLFQTPTLGVLGMIWRSTECFLKFFKSSCVSVFSIMFSICFLPNFPYVFCPLCPLHIDTEAKAHRMFITCRGTNWPGNSIRGYTRNASNLANFWRDKQVFLCSKCLHFRIVSGQRHSSSSGTDDGLAIEENRTRILWTNSESQVGELWERKFWNESWQYSRNSLNYSSCILKRCQTVKDLLK